jgi:hypothetical protein
MERTKSYGEEVQKTNEERQTAKTIDGDGSHSGGAMPAHTLPVND